MVKEDDTTYTVGYGKARRARRNSSLGDSLVISAAVLRTRKRSTMFWMRS